ncbi:type II secretion system F family protein [Roseateles chitinivorans]|uniref:type II secretion system F family protein n=1 Tax=Roseateles chitinivorans TaxID=2917965 RepID=UPI003D675EC3
MRFEIRGVGADHTITTVSLEAVSAEEATRAAEARAIRVLEVTARPTSAFSLRRSRFSLLLFSQELHALLNAGLGLVEALQGLAEKEVAGDTRTVLDHLLARLRGGQRLSTALTDLPHAFPPLFIGLVRAAETTGELPRALMRYVDYRARVESVRAKVISASIYPLILMAVGGLVTLFLAGYVVPRFAAVYQDSGRELPWASSLLLAAGTFLGAHALSVLAVTVGVLGAAGAALMRAVRSGALAAWAAGLPWLGRHVRLYELSRLYLTLGLLLESGVPAVQAMEMSRGVTAPAMAGRLADARLRVQAGGAFSEAFETLGLTTPISLRMLRVGEQSGQLGRMLMEAAAFYDGDVARFVERFTRAFEPLLMSAIGLIVGLIVLLLYMPIFDLAGSLG